MTAPIAEELTETITKPKPINKRAAARFFIVQALYELDISGKDLLQLMTDYENTRLGKAIEDVELAPADAVFFRHIVSGVVKNAYSINATIKSYLPVSWPFERIEIVLLNILRAGIFELKNRKDIPARVIISEYVDLAKAYFDDKEAGMTNAILEQLARTIRSEEFTPKHK